MGALSRAVAVVELELELIRTCPYGTPLTSLTPHRDELQALNLNPQVAVVVSTGPRTLRRCAAMHFGDFLTFFFAKAAGWDEA